MAAVRRRAATATIMTETVPIAFGIYTWGEDLIAANARDKLDVRYGDADFRTNVLRLGLMDSKGTITEKGWEVLNRDLTTLERNAMAWLRRKFFSARDDGHDSHGDLVGTVWADPRDIEQKKLLDIVRDGSEEKIDLGDIPNGYKGVSEFGLSVLGGDINFGPD